MNLFNVYPLYPIEPVKALGSHIWDKTGNQYLDLYGGHAVISIGHQHPHYTQKIRKQLEKVAFYSNSIINPLQQELAAKLGQLSGYSDYSLFLCNSGAEANENALKLASFHTGRDTVITFKDGFHGRTSAAVAITDNPKIIAPINAHHKVVQCTLNDLTSVEKALMTGQVCAVIIEGIQGLAGVYEPDPEFMTALHDLCKRYGTLLIIDEVQSGYGRTGQFFAHQHYNIKADIITTAKGMGNGFPIGGVLIHPDVKPWHGMLGTTFGGNHLACAAGVAVLEVIEKEGLIRNASYMETVIRNAFKPFDQILEIRGKGLLIGMEFRHPIAELRKDLVLNQKIFTGSAANKNTLRILPALSVSEEMVLEFKFALNESLKASELSV